MSPGSGGTPSKDADLLKRQSPNTPAGFRCAAARLRTDGRGPRLAKLPAAVWTIVTATAALSARAGEIRLPEADRAEPIVVAAESGSRWQEGQYEVWLLRGKCRICQGAGSARGDRAVVWIDHAEPTERRPSKIIAYMEGNVEVELDFRRDTGRLTDRAWLGRFYSSAGIEAHVGRVGGKPDALPDVYRRGVQLRTPAPAGAVRQTQFTEPGGPLAIDGQPMPPGTRRIRVFPRSNVPVQAQWFPDPQGDQWIAVIDSGVNLLVDGLQTTLPGAGAISSIDVSTDRLVIWTHGVREPDLGGQALQDENVPLEIYMEGNIVFRQGQRVIYAKRMYFDVTRQVGMVIDAEMLTPVRKFPGLMRLRADLVRQLGPDHFFAREGYLTSSRMGQPGYRLRASQIEYRDVQHPMFEPFTGRPVIDPDTGQQEIGHQQTAVSRDNVLFYGPVPIFYWPRLATDVEDPTFYVRGARIKNDRIYGTQVLTTWDAFQLLGADNKPAGTDWDLSLDYLGKRGFGHGTSFSYNRDQLLGLAGPAAGLIDYWGLKDDGTDVLGRGRNRLVPEEEYRFRLFARHRQQLAGDWQLTGELGWISDRNFLEEFYEREWDRFKDQATGLELKRIQDNVSFSATADARLNEFFTQTEWLPRADHFWLGQSLFHDSLTWYEHSSIGYARLRPAVRPTNRRDWPWDPLPWETPAREGERLLTRQEIDWPLQLGPVKLVPYALGELAHWGQALDGDDLQRFYYQTGLRASMPMWRANPQVENQLLNVHGIAHKVVFDAELCLAEANRELDELPLYDPLDDDSIEAFRRRLARLTFGAPPPVPRRFDERYYALRTGLGGWVTSPAAEIAGDLTALRMGVRQRWQTKRGMPGQRRIIDWIVLDANLTCFPDEDRDNFGQAAGLLDYDFRWHVGDRLTLVSDGLFDFFADGQQLFTIGGFLMRPPRGSLYLGLRVLEGPIDNRVLSFSYSYHMSPKWVSSFGTSVDLAEDGNIGQRFSITRIGESLLISAGVTVDAVRDNVGVQLAIEPRFLPKSRLGRVGGARIPVAGAYGLE